MSTETKNYFSGNYSHYLGADFFQKAMIESSKKVEKRKKYFQEDFARYFNVELINQNIVDPDVLPFLEKHDITEDPEYSQINVQRRLDLHSYYLERGAFPDDRRVYVAYASPELGFGVFANVYIPAWTIVAEYTGVITRKHVNTDYAWVYHSAPLDANGEKMKLHIDGRFKGNVGRFVNHSETPNCEVVRVPYQNRWRVLYVSNKAILPDEELTVSYGTNYWSVRNKVSH